MDGTIRRIRRQAGLTVVELLVALGLLSVVLGTLSVVVITGSNAARTTNDFLQTQAQVRAGLDLITDEARWAKAVMAASAESVTLLVPENTPFSASSPYTVTFAYDAVERTVTRQEDPDANGPAPAGAVVPIAYLVVQREGGAGLSFEYFDRGAASLGSDPDPADWAAVARVRIVVTTASRGLSRTMAVDVALRGKQD